MEELNERIMSEMTRYAAGGLCGRRYTRLWRLIRRMARILGDEPDTVFEHYQMEVWLNV